jgi:hypothetical protein
VRKELRTYQRNQQLGALASLPTIAVAILIALNAIPATLPLALVFAAALVIANLFGWRLVSASSCRAHRETSTVPVTTRLLQIPTCRGPRPT